LILTLCTFTIKSIYKIILTQTSHAQCQYNQRRRPSEYNPLSHALDTQQVISQTSLSRQSINCTSLPRQPNSKQQEK